MMASPTTDPLLTNCLRFGRLLRASGLPIRSEDNQLFLEALTAIGIGRKADVRSAGRAIFTRRREDRELFDRAFELFWQRHTDAEGAPILPRIRQDNRKPPTFPITPDGVGPMGTPLAGHSTHSAPSDREAIRHADFAELSDRELEEATALLQALAPSLPMRLSRRWRLLRGRGRRPARARMLRAALATSGEPLRWWWFGHPVRPRPIVLVCDISGSMERYSRLMLRFAHVLFHSGAPVEVFVFGTRLTRITRQLATRDTDTALRLVGRSVVDWNGGTRIGESLAQLNRHWIRRIVRSGSVVMLCSDGWERGDPALLAAEMARLRRSCYRLLWLDPLAIQPGFAPEVAGLKAALPYVDALLPCGSVAAIEAVAEYLGTMKGRR